jgi:cell wall-associated NlpC family hydrolase
MTLSRTGLVLVRRRARAVAALACLLSVMDPPLASGQQRLPGGSERGAAMGAWIFGGQTSAIPGSSFLGGGGLSLGSGPVSLRASGALNRQYLPTGRQRTPWVADVDAMLESRELGRALGILTRSFAPVGFVGIGRVGINEAAGEHLGVTTISYGGGASFHWFDGLYVTAEARYRTPLQGRSDRAGAAYIPGAFGRGTEVRLGLSFGGGRSTTSGSRTPGSVSRSPDIRSAPPSVTARRVLNTADNYLGVPYKWGGTSPTGGFDCSGFTQYVFAREGIQIPRNSRQQSRAGTAVPNALELARPGDLLFFAFGSDIDHVGIYVGDGRMIHATASGGEVRYDSFRGDRGESFLRHMVGIRRYMDDAGAPLQLSPTLLRELGRWAGVDGGDRAPAVGAPRAPR